MKEDISHRPRKHHAYTMTEVLVALSISTIVMLGVVSLLSLAGNAVPQPGGRQETAVDSADLLARLAADLACASQVTQAETDAITLILPDRTGDDIADTVSYSWGGGKNDPVIRDYNGKSITLLKNTINFQLIYARDAMKVYTPLSRSNGASQTHQSSLDRSGAYNQRMQKDIFMQVIAPMVPDNTVAWTLESVDVVLAKHGVSNAVLLFEVRGLDETLAPTDVVYATFQVDENDLPSEYAPWTFDLSEITLQPSDRVCFLVSVAGSGSIDVSLVDDGGWPSEAPCRISSDDGISWVTSTTDILSHRASGRVMTTSGGVEVRHALKSIETSIQAGSESWSTEVSLSIVNPAVIDPE